MGRWESKVLKAGDKLLVELPSDILQKKKLKRGDTVVFVEDMKGSIEIENKAHLDSNLCVICRKRESRNTCLSCGREVCSNCFFNMAGICHACGNFPKKRV
jgi:hypothetical protein